MATALAVTSALGLGKSIHDTKKAGRAEDREAKRLAVEKKKADKEKRLAAEATPFGAMGAGSRIAAEKQVLARRGGGSAAKTRRSGTIG